MRVIPTPGHTLSDVTVLVKTKDREVVAIAGKYFKRKKKLKKMFSLS